MDEFTCEQEMTMIDVNEMDWEERPNAKVGRSSFKKMLMLDPETGMRVFVVRYPAGFVTPWHDHKCAHGLYVLEGTLHTNEGNAGPGTFLWFPEGIVAEHGATEREDVVVLFMTNKTFNIHYVEKA